MTEHTLEDYQEALTAVQGAHKKLVKFDRELWKNSVEEIIDDLQRNINRLSPPQDCILIKVYRISGGIYNTIELTNVVIPATPLVLAYFDIDNVTSIGKVAFAELLEFFVHRKYEDRNQGAPVPQDLSSWEEELEFSDPSCDHEEVLNEKALRLIKYGISVSMRLGEDKRSEYGIPWDGRRYNPVRKIAISMNDELFKEIFYPTP